MGTKATEPKAKLITEVQANRDGFTRPGFQARPTFLRESGRRDEMSLDSARQTL